MLKIAKILVPILILAAGIWLALRGWDPEVRVAEASRGTAVDAVTGTIQVYSFADLWVRTEREGRLREILVEVGDYVEKNQLVAVQESQTLDFQLEQEQLRLEAAQERLKLPLASSFDLESLEAEIKALRLQVELGQLSESRLIERERDLRRLHARRAEEHIHREESAGILTSRVEELNYQREKTQLRAPVAGKVVEIAGVIGDRINANSNVLRILHDGRFVEMELSEEDFGGVQIGHPVTLRLASYPNREFHGKVDTLAATADAQSKTRKLTVSVEADPETLVPGLTGEGYLIKAQRDDVVLIPRRALIGHRVYVVNGGVVEIRNVQPGFLSLNRAEIMEGIEPGDLVVLEGQDRLRPGQSVKILTQ